MKLRNSYFCLILLVLFSCKGNEDVEPDEIHYISEENRVWLTDFETDTVMNFIDNNKISHDLKFGYSSQDFTESSTTVFGVTTNKSSLEGVFQNFYGSSFDFDLSISSTFDDSDEITVEVDGYSFTYDLDYQYLTYTSSPEQSIYDEIESTVTYLDSFVVNGDTHLGVLHFELKDFAAQWENETVTDIYISKDKGLIQFNTYQGVEFYLELNESD